VWNASRSRGNGEWCARSNDAGHAGGASDPTIIPAATAALVDPLVRRCQSLEPRDLVASESYPESFHRYKPSDGNVEVAINWPSGEKAISKTLWPGWLRTAIC